MIRGIHKILKGHKNIKDIPAKMSSKPSKSNGKLSINAVMYEYNPFSNINIPKKYMILCGNNSKDAKANPAKISINPRIIKNILINYFF